MAGETTGFFKIGNISYYDVELADFWILTKNLTVEEKKQLEDFSNDPGIKYNGSEFMNNIIQQNKWIALRSLHSEISFGPTGTE